MNEIWECVLANYFLGIHKSKIVCSVICDNLHSHIHIKYSILASNSEHVMIVTLIKIHGIVM
jgi:hypothetical protein